MLPSLCLRQEETQKKENIATAHTKCSSAHKKHKNYFLLTNTQKNVFKAKGLIFYLLLNTQNIKLKFFQFFNKKVYLNLN